MAMTIVASVMNVRTVQPTIAVGIDVQVQSTELQGQNAYRQYDGKQCRAISHRRILHEALQITNFVTTKRVLGELVFLWDASLADLVRAELLRE